MNRRIKRNDMGRPRLLDAINQNNSLIFIVFCFLLGLLIGVLIFKCKNAGGTYYTEEFTRLYTGLSGGFWKVLQLSLIQLLPFAAAVFLSGTCMVGAVLVPAIVALRGVSLGLMMGCAYADHGLMGIVFNLLILIPPAVISTLALILAARESLGFSLSLARLAVPGVKAPAIEQDFKLYCLRQLFVLLFFAAAALVQTLMSVSFISFFSF